MSNDAGWWGPMLLAANLGAATIVIAAGGPDTPNVGGPSVAQPDTTDGDFRSAAARHGGNLTDPDHAGIWKAAMPARGAMHGEFENNDPIGLSAGVKIEADCSINWVDPDSKKRYCFSTATSLVVFLDAPHSYLSRAMKGWQELNRGVSRR